jgi:hypothetical protein
MNYKEKKELLKQQRERDYQLGAIMEARYKNEILDYFNIDENDNNIKVKHSRYGTIDLNIQNKKTKQKISIEIKSRYCSRTEYVDTMYGINKLQKQLDDLREKKVDKTYSVFVFTDELCYYDVHLDCHRNGDIRYRSGGRGDRALPEWKDYAYILCDRLVTIRKF